METKKQTNLRTSNLVNAIREAILPCGSLVRGDVLVNIGIILEGVESIEECTDLEDEFKNIEWWMAIRKNGAAIFGGSGMLADWEARYSDESLAIYRIGYTGITKRFEMECIKVWERDEF